MLPLDVWRNVTDCWLEEIGQLIVAELCPSNGYPIEAYLCKQTVAGGRTKLAVIFSYVRDDEKCLGNHRNDPDAFFSKILDQWCADQTCFIANYEEAREYLIFQGFDPDNIPMHIELGDDESDAVGAPSTSKATVDLAA